MTSVATTVPATHSAPRWAWLPAPGTVRYHLLLLRLGIFVLGPLGGIAAAYMNFSLGFYVGGQVLAGILGSTVTFGYGAEGKHVDQSPCAPTPSANTPVNPTNKRCTR